MSQVSVVQYNISPQKLNILQQNTNANYSKPDDRQILILRKPPPILPQPKNYTKDDILITNPGRKGIKKTGGKDLKTNPQPIAVARRNARERNRVKQVNNGFATLRQHIPNFIAQAFENTNGRGNKKLSKVETLRMAVEYIRSLEELLTIDEESANIREKIDMSSCPSPISTLSQNDSNTSQTELTYNFVMSPSEEDDDDFSSIATSSPQQYIRINTSNNTYEIIPSNIYENSENLDPMSVDQHHLLTDTHLLGSDLEVNNQNLQYLQVNSLQTTACSLSPGMYSEGSLSPNYDSSRLNENTQQNCFIPVFATGKLGQNFNVQIKSEENDLPVISLKTENNEVDSQEGLDVISWWEQTQTHQPRS